MTVSPTAKAALLIGADASILRTFIEYHGFERLAAVAAHAVRSFTSGDAMEPELTVSLLETTIQTLDIANGSDLHVTDWLHRHGVYTGLCSSLVELAGKDAGILERLVAFLVRLAVNTPGHTPGEHARVYRAQPLVLIVRISVLLLEHGAEAARSEPRDVPTAEGQLLETAGKTAAQAAGPEGAAAVEGRFKRWFGLLNVLTQSSSGPYHAVNREAFCAAGAVQAVLQCCSGILSGERSADAPYATAIVTDFLVGLSAHRMTVSDLRLLFSSLWAHRPALLDMLAQIVRRQEPCATWPSIEFDHSPGGHAAHTTKLAAAWPPGNGYSVSCWVRIDRFDPDFSLSLFSVGTEVSPHLHVSARIEVQKGEQHSLVLRSTDDRNAAVCTGFDFSAAGWHHISVVHSCHRFLGTSTVALYVDAELRGAPVKLPYPPASRSKLAGGDVLTIGDPSIGRASSGAHWVGVGPFLLFEECISFAAICRIFISGPDHRGCFHSESACTTLGYRAFLRPEVLIKILQGGDGDEAADRVWYGQLGGRDVVDLKMPTIPQPSTAIAAVLAAEQSVFVEDIVRHGLGGWSAGDGARMQLGVSKAHPIRPQPLADGFCALGGPQLILLMMESAGSEDELCHAAEILTAIVEGGGTQVEMLMEVQNLYAAIPLVLRRAEKHVSPRCIQIIAKLCWSTSWASKLDAAAGFGQMTIANYKIMFPLMTYLWLPSPAAIQSTVLKAIRDCIDSAENEFQREFNIERLKKLRLLAALLMLLMDKATEARILDHAIDLVRLMLVTPQSNPVDALMSQVREFLISTLSNTTDRTRHVRDRLLSALRDDVVAQMATADPMSTGQQLDGPFFEAARRVFSPTWLLLMIDPSVEATSAILALDMLKLLHLLPPHGAVLTAKFSAGLETVYERLGVVLPLFGHLSAAYQSMLALIVETNKRDVLRANRQGGGSSRFSLPLHTIVQMVRGGIDDYVRRNGPITAVSSVSSGAAENPDALDNAPPSLVDVGLRFTAAIAAAAAGVDERLAAAPESTDGRRAAAEPSAEASSAVTDKPAAAVRKVAATWEAEGSLGIKFTADLKIAAMAPNTQCGFPQLEEGMGVLSVNGGVVAGLSNDAALALVREASRPVTLVFGAAAAEEIAPSTRDPKELAAEIMAAGPIECEAVHENERLLMGRWSAKSLRATDMAPWTDRHGREAADPLASSGSSPVVTSPAQESASLMSSLSGALSRTITETRASITGASDTTARWQWVTDWAGDPTKDAAGSGDGGTGEWEYAAGFKKAGADWGANTLLSVVRRRRWLRLRCLASGDLYDAHAGPALWALWAQASEKLVQTPRPAVPPAPDTAAFLLANMWATPALLQAVGKEQHSPEIWAQFLETGAVPQQVGGRLLPPSTGADSNMEPAVLVGLLKRMVIDMPEVRAAAAVFESILSVLIEILVFSTRPTSLFAENPRELRSEFQLEVCECIGIVLAGAAGEEHGHRSLCEVLELSHLHCQDEVVASNFYTRIISYLMRFYTNRLRAAGPRSFDSAGFCRNFEQFCDLIVDLSMSHQLLNPPCIGIVRFVIATLRWAVDSDAAGVQNGYERQDSLITKLRHCLRQVIVFVFARGGKQPLLQHLQEQLQLLHLILDSRAVSVPAICADQDLLAVVCCHLAPMLYSDSTESTAMRLWKQFLIHKPVAVAKLLVAETESIGPMDILHGAFDRLLVDPAAFKTWAAANKSSVELVIDQTARPIWNHIVSEQGESWLTAAVPVDNPYCSCKLTRVRRRQAPSSAATSSG